MLEKMTAEDWAEAKEMIETHGPDARMRAELAEGYYTLGLDYPNQYRYRRIAIAIAWLQNDRGRDPFRVEH